MEEEKEEEDDDVCTGVDETSSDVRSDECGTWFDVVVLMLRSGGGVAAEETSRRTAKRCPNVCDMPT